MTETESYLKNRALKALENSLGLIAEILKFQILELWIKDGEDVSCQYVYGTNDVVQRFPWLKFGYQPERLHNPEILDKMKELSQNGKKYEWSMDVTPETKLAPREYKSKTELSYLISPETSEKAERSNILLLGFSADNLTYSASKLKFLGGIGTAIAIAFYEFEDDDSDEELLQGEEIELDEKKFSPSKPLVPSSTMLFNNNILDPNDPASNLSLGVWGKNLSEANLAAHFGEEGMYLHHEGEEEEDNPDDEYFSEYGNTILEEDFDDAQVSAHLFLRSVHSDNNDDQFNSETKDNGSTAATENSDNSSAMNMYIGDRSPVLEQPLQTEKKSPLLMIPKLQIGNSGSTANIHGSSRGPTPRSVRARGGMSARSASGFYSARSARSDLSTARSVTPTWQPTATYSFPVIEIPSKLVADDLSFNDFYEVKHLGDGSNSNIYLGKLHNQRVIIKMIKEKQQLNPITIHEFDLEHGMLSRINHPNIIKLLGAGRHPRRFIVLEYLSGGTLNTLLVKNQSQPGLTSKLFRKPSFTYQELLIRGREIADALDYLHRRCHPGACIIHRDLKPDNIGFTEDGSFKLFDFGLVTCVKQRMKATDAYQMTGFTGSLRYMAPEVALCASYTEKVDVYSFGILIWQMARDRIPFKGLNKEEFMKSVVMDGDRPKLDSSWPPEFTKLLTSCWHKEAIKRPSFEQVVLEIDKLLATTKATPPQPAAVPFLMNLGKQKTEPAKITTWF